MRQNSQLDLEPLFRIILLKKMSIKLHCVTLVKPNYFKKQSSPSSFLLNNKT